MVHLYMSITRDRKSNCDGQVSCYSHYLMNVFWNVFGRGNLSIHHPSVKLSLMYVHGASIFFS